MSSYTTPNKRHYSVEEQANRLPLYLREFYAIRQLDRIKIDGTEIQGYFEYSYTDEKSYVTQPERSAGGTIDNLNSYATFFTPRLVIKYNYMHIGEYRKLMQLLNSKNEFVVECYDIVLDKRVVHKMYHATPQMPTIHQRNLEVLGIIDYTVELIGTNSELETVDILYYDNDGNLIADATQTAQKGTDIIINYNFEAPLGYRFEGVWLNESDVQYNNGDAVFISPSMDNYLKLRPKLINTDEYTLSFAYGNGQTLYSRTTGAINSINIRQGDSINSAITRADITLDNGKKFTFPEDGTGAILVQEDVDEFVLAHDFKGWYWTTEAHENTRVTGSTIYSSALNRTIYQIYEPRKFNIIFVTNTDNISYEPQDVPYGSFVDLPVLYDKGHKFMGWYEDSEFKKQFTSSTPMPPKHITLYAKWEANQ